MSSYYDITKEDLGKNAKIDLLKLGDSGEVFYEIAMDMVNVIEKNNEHDKRTVFICPVGPVGQYSIFARLVNERRINLKNCWFINMDEYLDDDLNWIDINHRLSFRGFMKKNLYDRIDDELLMSENQRIFPDPKHPLELDKKIEALGGVDVCYGGIGINGHVAFNEPDAELSAEDFAKLPTRILPISKETVAINSVGDLSGAIEIMPKNCITIGMKNIVAARRILLACFRDWHRAVVRRACYGEISAEFPVTILQEHTNIRLLINDNAGKEI